MSKVTYLPVPTLESWQWQGRATCKDMGTMTFFHPDGERGGIRRRHAAVTKTTCANCPVLEQCRSYALAAHEPYGVWGGMTEEKRATYRKGQETKTT